MVEEALNFGMNATQISQVSGLKSRVSDLDFSIQNVLDELNEIRDEQVLATKKQEEMALRQEKEDQIQKAILSLKNSIFNLKTEMEETYQSDELSIEDKYLEFRNVCNSPILEKLNPDYFDKFEDKEYTLSVKKYLFTTRDELFDSLGDSKKSILKVIINKKINLENLINKNIKQPYKPQEPIFNKRKIKHLTKPTKPSNYLTPSQRTKYEKTANTLGNIFFRALIPLSIMLIVDIYLQITKNSSVWAEYYSNFTWTLVGLIITMFIFVLVFSITEDAEKGYIEYDTKLKVYLEREKANRQLHEEYESKHINYIVKYDSIMQNYQDELKKYENYQSSITILKQEIYHLYQSFIK